MLAPAIPAPGKQACTSIVVTKRAMLEKGIRVFTYFSNLLFVLEQRTKGPRKV